MADPAYCQECRAIARELEEVYVDLVNKGLLNALDDPRVMEERLTAWRAWIRDGELHGQTLPTIAPGILDLSRSGEPPAAVHPLARVFHKKITHEIRTGHQIKFPPEI